MKYLGIDYSMRKVGLALGDADARVAVPLEVIPGGDDVVERLLFFAKKEDINAFVVGVPVPFRQEQHDTQFDRVKAFTMKLALVSGLPVHEIDEVMTTREARRVRHEYQSTVSEDALAAMFILQEYLDGLTG